MQSGITLNSRWTVVIHLLVWSALITFPYLFSFGNPQGLGRMVEHSWAPLVYYAITFYINYFLLIDRLLFRKKIGAYVLSNILLVAVLLAIHQFLKGSDLFGEPPGPPPKHSPPNYVFIIWDASKFLVPIIVAVAVKTTLRWLRSESERKEAENIRLQSDLQNLKYQLQPHFFFNSLNNIYSLVDVSPEDAKKTIHTLGKLMRYLLYEADTERISLDREVDFLGKYIELMKLRSPESTVVTYQFPKGCANVEVAPLLFISLIENAFKHGISASLPSVLTFKMNVENGVLTFVTMNTNFPKSDDDKSGSGVGLENLRRRLELLYHGKHELTTEIKDDNFIATLKLDLN